MMHCDVFILLDDAQYTKNSLINRNKIKGSQGEILLTVPVRASLETKISDVEIAHPKATQKHLKAIQANYAKAPYFKTYFDEIGQILTSSAELSELNEALIRQIAHWLGITCDIVRSSDFEVHSVSDHRLVDLVQAVDGQRYLSGEGGKSYQADATYQNADIELQYTGFSSPMYPQQWGPFIFNLSVIDILLNCGPEAGDLIRNSKKEQI